MLRGHLAEELMDEAAAAARSWTGHMILLPPFYFSLPLCVAVSWPPRGPNDESRQARGWSLAVQARGGGVGGCSGGEHHLRENSCSPEGQPPTTAPFLSRPDCQTMFSPPHPHPTPFPAPAAPSSILGSAYCHPHAPLWPAAAVGGTINSVCPVFSFPASLNGPVASS